MLILQLFNLIILPFIATIFLLNDYGKYWINLWNYCADNQLKKQFDVTTYDYFTENYTILLSTSDIGATSSLFDMNALDHFYMIELLLY